MAGVLREGLEAGLKAEGEWLQEHEISRQMRSLEVRNWPSEVDIRHKHHVRI